MKAKKFSLIGELNSLGIDVNCKFPNINCGGCAVFASIVGEALQEMGVEVKILVAGNSYTGTRNTVDQARLKVKNVGRKTQWRDNGITFGHVGVEFLWNGKLYHYDSNGCHRPKLLLDGCQIFKGRLTVEECIAVAKEARGWNDTYNRRHTPALRKMVHQHFEQMKVKL